MAVIHKDWYDVDGDNTYAITWPLTKDSVVFEVGAYEGRWAKQIINKYHCVVHAFEPQYWAVAKLLILQATGYEQLVVYPYALGNRDITQLPMGEFETDACSFLLPKQRKQGYGEMREACNAINEVSGTQQIDLMMMNIEGYEYELINYMISCGAIERVERLCVQWHEFADPSGVMYKVVRDKLFQEGFHIEWSFYPTLEAFVR